MATSKVIFIVFSIIFISSVSGQEMLMASYLERQLQCALDKAPCDYYGYQIKRSLPFILNNAECKHCDPSKMTNAQLLASFIQIRHPEIYNELMMKYGMKNRSVESNAAI